MLDIREYLKNRLLILDGAMGTMIQRLGLEESAFRGERFNNHEFLLKGNYDLLSLTSPQVISNIHEAYLKAGADIITTNTFNSTNISMAQYKMENLVDELNFESAKLAKKIASKYSSDKKPRWVAGSIGPTNKACSTSLEKMGFEKIEPTQLYEAYKEQVKALMRGRVDIILVETIFDLSSAKMALRAIYDCFDEMKKDLPVMVSATISETTGNIYSGETIKELFEEIRSFPILSIGINCSFGARRAIRSLNELGELSNIHTSAHLNAGLPNNLGVYDETPEMMKEVFQSFIQNKTLNIIGGCCGTTEEHVRMFVELVESDSITS